MPEFVTNLSLCCYLQRPIVVESLSSDPLFFRCHPKGFIIFMSVSSLWKVRTAPRASAVTLWSFHFYLILYDFNSHASSSIETRFPATQSQGPDAAWGHRKLNPWGESDSQSLPQPGRPASISSPEAVSVEGSASFSHSAPVSVL